MKYPLLKWKLFIVTMLVSLHGYSFQGVSTQVKNTNLKQSIVDEETVTLNKTLSVEDLIKYLDKTSDYSFFYDNKIVELKNSITLNVKNASFVSVLEKLCKAASLEYKITDMEVVLRKIENDDQDSTPVKITGRVKDSTGETLPGVSVFIKGTTTGTSTDFDGNFTLEVEKGQILSFSFIGYSTKEVVYNGQLNFDIVLEEDSQVLADVVVVGYGVQKKESVTGSISSVKGAELVEAPVASTSNTLAGRMPGLISKQVNGRPGNDAANLSIRGFGSALTIVDGIEADINSIDPNSIESVTILKDGAASIYGARAGNGVILITTKRGRNEDPKVNLNSSFTWQGVTTMPKTLSSGQYAEMLSEEWLNAGKPESSVPYTPEQIQKFYDEADPYLYPNTNWYDELIRDWAPQQQHNLSVRGGSERIKYYGFISYLNQETMFKNNGGEFSRYNLQSNIDAKITDQLSLRLDLSSINKAQEFPIVSQDIAGAQGGTIWNKFWATLPIYPAHLPDPTKYAYNGNDGQADLLSNRDIIGYSDIFTNDLKATVSLNYKFKWVEGLSAKAFVNINQIYSRGKYFQKPADYYVYDPGSDIYTQIGGFSPKALMGDTRNENRMITSQLSLNYEKTFGDHYINALALYEAIDYSGNSVYAGRLNFLTASIDQLFVGSPEDMTNNGSSYEMGRKSIVGRFNYKYKNRYILETSLRADASAKFPDEHRWGYFPSASVGWIISEEGFMNDFSQLEHLKIRGSYGESGNDGIGNFQYLTGYTVGGSYIFGDVMRGISPKELPNEDLTWENVKIINAGVDFSLWNRKFYGETDVFYRRVENILGNRLLSVPSTFGAVLPVENLNIMDNRGFEFKVGTSGETNDFFWDVSANVSWTRAKYVDFEEPEYTDPDDIRIRQRTGRWADRIYMLVSEGLFTSQEEINSLPYDIDGLGNSTLRPGDVKYKDVNRDGIINWRDQVEVGTSTIPNWMYGLTFGANYKGFELTGLFQGAFGYSTWVNIVRNSDIQYNERWTETNNYSNVLIPRLGGAASNSWGSTQFLKDAGYLRLKTLNFGYNLPEKWIEKVGLDKFKIYVAGTNLLTFDKLGDYGMDPEAPSGSSGLYYPQQKTVTVGVNVSF